MFNIFNVLLVELWSIYVAFFPLGSGDSKGFGKIALLC